MLEKNERMLYFKFRHSESQLDWSSCCMMFTSFRTVRKLDFSL